VCPTSPCSRVHDAFGEQLFLLGSALAGYFVHDAIRVLDFAASLTNVDSSRMGMIGTSGGGMLTAYVGAIDDRIQASVISSWFGSWRHQARSMVCHHDAEQIWWEGLSAMGMDKSDLLVARTPKPTMVANGALDGCASAEDALDALESARQGLAALDADVSVSLTEGRHGWHASQLDNVYRFLDFSLQLGGRARSHVPFSPVSCSHLLHSGSGPGSDKAMAWLPGIVAHKWA